MDEMGDNKERTSRGLVESKSGFGEVKKIWYFAQIPQAVPTWTRASGARLIR